MSKSLWQYLLGGLFALILILALLGLMFSWGNSAALATTVVIMVGALILVPVSSRLTEIGFGPSGIVAKVSQLENVIEKTKDQVKEQEAKVRQQGEQLEKQQEIINQLVTYSMSRSIFDHLCGITILKYYVYKDDDQSRREMYFLRDHGFIRPKPPLNFVVFEQLPGQDPKKNLAEFAEPTEIVWFYVDIRRSDIPANMLDPKNRNNLREESIRRLNL
jgi:hypothetical protein